MANSQPSYPTSFKIDASSNNIPTSPSSGAGSRAFNALLSNNAWPCTHICVNNETAGRLKIIFVQQANQSVPSDATSVQSMYIPANTYKALDGISVGDAVYVVSDTGSAISTGIVTLEVW